MLIFFTREKGLFLNDSVRSYNKRTYLFVDLKSIEYMPYAATRSHFY